MAVFTPGTASMRSTVCLKVWRMRSLLLVLAGDRLSEKVRTWSGSNPGWTRPRLQRVRSIRPAPARSTSAAATSDTTSTLRRRRCPVDEPRLPSFKVSCRSVTETWSAGASPNTTPVTSESAQGEGEHPAVHSDVLHARQAARHGREHRPRAQPGDGEPGDAAGERQHHALGQQLADDAGPCGAQCEADGHLLLAPGEAGQEQVRHVGAGDEEHEADGAQQDQQGGADVSDDRAGERRDLDAVLRVRLRVGFGQARRDRVHFRLRLASGDAGLEPPHCTDAGMHLARPDEHVVPLLEEGVDVGLAFELELGGNDSRHGEAAPVERERAPDYGGARTEAPAPQAATDEDHGCRTEPVVCGVEVTARHGVDSEDAEEVGRDHLAAEVLGLPSSGHVGVLPAERGQALEAAAVLLPVDEVRIGDRHAREVRRRLAEPHQAVGIAVGQRLEENAVDDAEDGGVGADPERQRDHRDGREARVPGQHAQAVPNVLEQDPHVASCCEVRPSPRWSQRAGAWRCSGIASRAPRARRRSL